MRKRFRSDAEETEWYDKNQDWLLKRFREAARRGTLHRGAAAALLVERARAKNITIRIPEDDIERARHLSGKKGLRYQTYMKVLLREALAREENLTRPSR